MVSTVFSKKQFTVLSIEKEELKNLMNDLRNRNHLILYPCFTKQDVENVSDLINEKMQKSIINEIDSNTPRKLGVKNWTGFRVKGVQSIESIYNNMFRIRTEHGSFMSDSFELFVWNGSKM